MGGTDALSGGLCHAQSPADAIALEQQGKLAEAAQAWRAVTRQNPQDAPALPVLCRSIKEENTPKRPRRTGKHWLLIQSFQELRSPGLAEFKQGPLQAAGSTFQCGDAATRTIYRRARCWESATTERNDSPTLAKHLGIAAKADLDNTELHHMLAKAVCGLTIYLRLGGIPSYLQRDPDSATAHMLMGQALDGLAKNSGPSLDSGRCQSFSARTQRAFRTWYRSYVEGPVAMTRRSRNSKRIVPGSR